MRAHLRLVTTFLVVVAGCTPESPATETSVTASSDTSWSDNSPRFSPDGSKLVFSSDRYGHDDIFTIPVEGGQPARITDDPGLDLDPSFLPDGRILFDSDRDGTV